VQAAWLLFALIALTIALPGIASYTRLMQTVCHGSGCLVGQLTAAEVQTMIASGDSLAQYAELETTIHLFGATLLVVTAACLIWCRPTNRAAVLGAFVLTALATSTLAQAMAQSVPAVGLPAQLLRIIHIAGLLPFLGLILDGRFRPAWLRWVALATMPISLLIAFDLLAPAGLTAFSGSVGVLIIVGIIHHYRSLPAPPEQEQVAWALAAAALLIGAQWLGSPFRPLSGPVVPLDALPPTFISYYSVIGMLFVVGALSCLAVALLSDELFRVDVALSRALVYSLLTLFVVGGYVLIVGYLSLLFQSSGNLWFSLIASGLVAALFQPIRTRVQRFVNQLLYGERDDPYHVIAHLRQRLEAAFEPSTIPATIAETVRESLRLPYVGLTINYDGRSELVAATGTALTEPISFPLTYQGATIGHLLINPRRGDTTLAAVDRALLADLAQQAGLAIHGVRLMAELQGLTTDLQQSRERLVLAREEERRRLRRDLHDDLAPTLAGLAISASTMSDLILTDTAKAVKVADGLDNGIRQAVRTIRRLVYDLRPAALDELGLLMAIRERVTQFSVVQSEDGLYVDIDAPDALPALPAAVEVAAYRIVQEALMNVVKHAQARTCQIRIVLTDVFTVEIRDDGLGLPATRTEGVGLRSMRERAAELGGTCQIEGQVGQGTRICVCLPITGETSP
jgi:signal transduction histidine kinase